jgi:hypothetical protein
MALCRRRRPVPRQPAAHGLFGFWLDLVPVPFVLTARGDLSGCEASTVVTSGPEPSLICWITLWWGTGAQEPGVPPDLQDPVFGNGHLNLYGIGFAPSEELYLLINGQNPPVPGGFHLWAYQSGETEANGNDQGFMEYIETNYLPPFVVTVAGKWCTASTQYGTLAPLLIDEAAVNNSPLPPVLWGLVGLGVGMGATAGGLMLRRRFH